MKKDVTLDVSKGAKASPLSKKSALDFVQKYTMVLVLVLVAAFFTREDIREILHLQMDELRRKLDENGVFVAYRVFTVLLEL